MRHVPSRSRRSGEASAYFKNPAEAQRRTAAGGDILGFGVGGAATFLTPVILAVMTEVVAFLAAELKKQLRAESATTIATLVKRLFKPFAAAAASAAPAAAAATPPPLTRQQIDRIYALAIDQAKLFNLPEPQAQQLADSVVSNLVRSP